MTRTGTVSGWRFTPYGIHHSHPVMYENADAGPSTQPPPPIPYDTRPTTRPPPPIPYDTRPTTQPTGGTSETTADAEQSQTITEEDETPVCDFYCSPIPHVTVCLFGARYLGPDVPTVSRTTRTYSSCGHGRKLCEGAGDSQATKTQSLVSTYPPVKWHI